MTRLTVTGQLDISYNFPAGQNDGKISSQKDNISLETVTYQYDSLNRLLSASSSQSWNETYGFDGFGNLLTKTGTGGAPALLQSVNPANNQIVGQSYDSNGNQMSSLLGTVTYDGENRIASAAGVQYAYDSRNKRIWKSILSNGNLAQEVYFYGVDGQKIGTYTLLLTLLSNSPEMLDNNNPVLAVFFGSKRVGTFDRLGTAKYNANGQPQSFYPYGEDRGTVQPNDSLKFATYTRDTATGLDYADQRYYASNFGRFMSPDPYQSNTGGPGDPNDPGSWNRFAYTGADPINRFDPSGNCWAFVTAGGQTTAEYYECGVPVVMPGVQTGSHHVYTDPLPLSIGTSWSLARAYQKLVAQRQMTDCQALASFAQDVADATQTNDQFIRDLSVLIPKTAVGSLGLKWWNVGAVALNSAASPTPSGYNTQFQNTQPDNPATGWNGDQGHHFAAFLEYGYLHGTTNGMIAANLYEQVQGFFSGVNMGDINLGEDAAAWGALLAAGQIDPGTIAANIATTLCKH